MDFFVLLWMQHHLSTIKIPSKPHVAQYIRTVFLNQEAIISIPSDDLILPLIVSCSTDQPTLRYQHSLGGYEHIDILLPNKHQHLWIDQDKAKTLTKLLEKYFWTRAEIYIYRILTDQRKISFKEDAIREFLSNHYITESIYPLGNFRRQLKRLDVKGTRAELPDLRNPISYKLTRQQCMQVYRLKKHHKISLRIIAKHYQISHESARKIIENISQQSVPKPDKKLTA